MHNYSICTNIFQLALDFKNVNVYISRLRIKTVVDVTYLYYVHSCRIIQKGEIVITVPFKLFIFILIHV